MNVILLFGHSFSTALAVEDDSLDSVDLFFAFLFVPSLHLHQLQNNFFWCGEREKDERRTGIKLLLKSILKHGESIFQSFNCRKREHIEKELENNSEQHCRAARWEEKLQSLY